MRHKISGRKLKRSSAHKKAMLSNMSTSLLKHERLKTTLAKAKELRTYVEPIIHRAKESSLHNKREILKKINNRKIVVKLFDNIALRYKNRNGGYTRIIRLGKHRPGDSSNMAIIELVEEALISESKPNPDKKSSSQKNKPKENKQIENKSEEKNKSTEDSNSDETK